MGPDWLKKHSARYEDALRLRSALRLASSQFVAPPRLIETRRLVVAAMEANTAMRECVRSWSVEPDVNEDTVVSGSLLMPWLL